MEVIGKNIRRARTMRKCSVAELSSRTSLSKYKIKQFEAGESFQSIEDLLKISKALNVSFDFLFKRHQEISILKLRRNKIPEKDRLAAIEMARYASRGPVFLLKQFKMDIFEPISRRKLDNSEARDIGKLIAQEWSDSSSLSSILETKGFVLVKIPSETSRFHGLFMVNEGVPVIALNKTRNSSEEMIEDIAHELGHAIFLKQKLDDRQEEAFCDSFAEGFSEEFIKINGPNIGEFDFLERKTRDAWIEEMITTSRAAELLEVSIDTIRERIRNEWQW